MRQNIWFSVVFFAFPCVRWGKRRIFARPKQRTLYIKTHRFKKNDMKKILFVALAAAALSACQTDPKFNVEGTVAEAEGKTLYIEAAALEGILPLDSVKLKGNGSFSFKQPRPKSPEFFRLRVDEKVINFSADSTETIRIQAAYPTFTTQYSVEGSANSQRIKELTLKQMELQKNVNALTKAMQGRAIGVDAYQDSLATLLKSYKDDVKINYIFSAPNTASAYFALFQKLNGYLIFDPLNSKEDVKCFSAVATSLNNFYPHADRSRNLYNIALKGMKNTRTPQQKVVEISEEQIGETGVIDINLRDMKGNAHKLTDLKGKVVIVDFTIYQSAVSASHNYMLRDLYDKYADKGLEIYQISLDADEHYWKTTAGNLPWICVRDANGIYSSIASIYNVQNLPTLFLVNRANELSARGETITDLEAAVKRLL